MSYWRLNSPAYKCLLAAKAELDKCGLEKDLLTLVYLRVSQINGCEYCIALHQKEARAAGIAEATIDAVAKWRSSENVPARLHLALEWAEAVTQLPSKGVSEPLCGRVAIEFPNEQHVNLTTAISLMNALNRLSISYGRKPQ